MSSTSSARSRLTMAKSWTREGSAESFAWWRMRWAIWATDMRPVARSSMSAGCTPGLPARLSMPLAPRPPSQPSTYSMTMRALRRVPSTVRGRAGHLGFARMVGGRGHGRGGLRPGGHGLLERTARRLHVEDMGDPSANEALRGLPLFAGANALRGDAVHLRIVAGQGGGHAAD